MLMKIIILSIKYKLDTKEVLAKYNYVDEKNVSLIEAGFIREITSTFMLMKITRCLGLNRELLGLSSSWIDEKNIA